MYRSGSSSSQGRKKTIAINRQPYDFSSQASDSVVATMHPSVQRLRDEIQQGTATLPSIALELALAAFVKSVRQWFKHTVTQQFVIDLPKDSLNRWLFDMLSLSDPVEKSPEFSSSNIRLIFRCPTTLLNNTEVIARELRQSIPARLRPSYSDNNRLIVDAKRYKGRCMTFLTAMRTRFGEDEAIKDDLNTLSLALEGFDPTILHPSVMEEKLRAVASTCLEFVEKYLEEDFTDLCKKLVEKVAAFETYYKELGYEDSDFTVTMKRGEHSCEFTLTSTKPFPDQLDRGERVLQLSTIHYHKLQTLYGRVSMSFDLSQSNLNQLVFILLRRYKTFMGSDRFEGASFHAAAPEGVFTILRDMLNVRQECFASPFNCFFSQFCSAFPDLDAFFGSCGSFFDFDITEGSLECGPPYTEECLDRTAEYLVRLLAKSKKPLMFVVFVPEWRTPPAKYHAILETSPYTLFHFCAPGGNHYYVCGNQFEPQCTLSVGAPMKDRDGRFYVVPHGTHVYFVCNPAGLEAYAQNSVEYLESVADAVLNRLMNPLGRPGIATVHARDYMTAYTYDDHSADNDLEPNIKAQK